MPGVNKSRISASSTNTSFPRQRTRTLLTYKQQPVRTKEKLMTTRVRSRIPPIYRRIYYPLSSLCPEETRCYFYTAALNCGIEFLEQTASASKPQHRFVKKRSRGRFLLDGCLASVVLILYHSVGKIDYVYLCDLFLTSYRVFYCLCE